MTNNGHNEKKYKSLKCETRHDSRYNCIHFSHLIKGNNFNSEIKTIHYANVFMFKVSN